MQERNRIKADTNNENSILSSHANWLISGKF